MTITYKEERLSAEEYIDFLKRTDLGSQYPKERFRKRIEKLVQNASISLAARNEEGKIVGVLFGLTVLLLALCHRFGRRSRLRRPGNRHQAHESGA